MKKYLDIIEGLEGELEEIKDRYESLSGLDRLKVRYVEKELQRAREFLKHHNRIDVFNIPLLGIHLRNAFIVIIQLKKSLGISS